MLIMFLSFVKFVILKILNFKFKLNLFIKYKIKFLIRSESLKKMHKANAHAIH